MVFVAWGEQNNAVVHSHAVANTAVFFDTPYGRLYRQSIDIEPIGYANYTVTVPYARRSRETGTFSFTFDTTGGTVHITAGKQHVQSFPQIANLDDPHKGSIGVTKDGEIEGCDIVVPACKFTYTFRHPEGEVDELFALDLARNTGKTNLNQWRVFRPGEALFMGATGTDGVNTEAELTYSILASENAGNLSIGEIVNVVKRGHDYLWVEFKPAVAGGKAATQPFRVHVERVYDAVDFATVFRWS